MKMLDRTIQLIGPEMAIEGIFMVFEDSETNDKWVQHFMYFGLHEIARHNASHPLVLMDGVIMRPEAFLGWIANVVRWDMDKNEKGFYFALRTTDNPSLYVQVNLRQGLSANEIEKLTGFNVEMVRDFYKDYILINWQEVDDGSTKLL